jgi:uncharacterized membrane protein
MFAAAIPVAAIAVAAAIPRAHGGGDDYTAELLSNPDSVPYIYANDINAGGRIIGAQEEFVVGRGWTIQAVLWKKWSSDPVKLEALEGHNNSWAAAINERGQICGYSTDRATEQNAVIWDKYGDVRDMHPDLDGTFSQMWDINQYGDAVGIDYVPHYARAFIVLDGGDPEYLELDTDVYIQSWPFEIDKDGVVVGHARVDAGYGWGPIHACYWDEDGSFYDLHEDIEDDLGISVTASRAWYTDDSGRIGGMAVVSLASNGWVEDGRPFVWNESEGFVWVDTDGEDLAFISGGSGKRFIGGIGGIANGIEWYDATAAVWVRGTENGATVWSLETVPLIDGQRGMVAYGANPSGRLVGATVDEFGYWSAWYAEK